MLNEKVNVQNNLSKLNFISKSERMIKMTAQIGDRFRLEDTEYSVVAISNPIKFDPRVYRITPVPACTACRRGYWCVYNITEEGIFLEDLYINSQDDYYPEINGVLPV